MATAGEKNITDRINDGSNETQPVPGKWLLEDGEYDSATIFGKDIQNILNAGAKNLVNPESQRRIKAVNTILYAIKITSPGSFETEVNADEIESDVIRAAQVCSFYSDHQLNEDLRKLASDMPEQLAAMAALRAFYNQERIDCDTRELGEGIIRFIYLKQTGRERELPAAYTDSSMRWKR